MWQEGWSLRGVGDVAIGQFLQRRASTYTLGYLSWAVPCSRIFGFSGWAVGSHAKRWSQALAAGLLQNRSLRYLWLSPFGSSLWLCVGSRGTPGRQAPAGGRSGRERRCAPQRWGATVRPSLGWNEMWIVCEMNGEWGDCFSALDVLITTRFVVLNFKVNTCFCTHENMYWNVENIFRNQLPARRRTARHWKRPRRSKTSGVTTLKSPGSLAMAQKMLNINITYPLKVGRFNTNKSRSDATLQCELLARQ